MNSDNSIFYLCPDYDRPSWGIGLLYAHVRMLRQNGISASVVHRTPGFRTSWTTDDVPVLYLEDSSFRPSQRDVLVVPEVLASSNGISKLDCRRFVFVQGVFLIHQSLGEAVNLSELGYEHAIAVLPHVKDVVESHYGLQADVIPPFIAPYFFADAERLDATQRTRRLVMFPKPGYRKAGYYDYEIVLKNLQQRLSEWPGWELVELSGRRHEEVAETLKESMFLVCVNCLEAFNTTVPEAMAAGCIPICYEAYGGRDFLSNRQNAFVYSNNEVFPLLSKVYELIENCESLKDQLAGLRRAAYQTASSFIEEKTEAELLRFVSKRVLRRFTE